MTKSISTASPISSVIAEEGVGGEMAIAVLIPLSRIWEITERAFSIDEDVLSVECKM